MVATNSLIAVALAPFEGAYRAVTWARNRLYDCGLLPSYESCLPVVCIGNISSGGNGKTPLCLFLVQQLKSRGFHPVVLTRGYGGRLKGPHRVCNTDTPLDVGDEAVLMSQQSGVPVVVARARAAGARYIESAQLGDVIVLDDGFQHRALRRDIDIVSIFVGNEDAVNEFIEGRLIPCGRLREERFSALTRASCVVLSYRRILSEEEASTSVDSRILSAMPRDKSVFRASFELLSVRSLVGDISIEPQRVHAVAAIANPEGFFASLQHLGFQVERSHVWSDHHIFSEEELGRLIGENPGTLFVCTEKDGVKIRSMSLEVASAFAECRVRLKVEPLETFIQLIVQSIESFRDSSDGES